MSDTTATPAAPAAELNETDALAAFEAFSAARAPVADPAPAPVETPDPDEETPEATPAAPAAAATPAPTPAPAAAEPPAAATDIWASATPELRAAHEAALAERDHRYQSDIGRQAAHQRTIQALRDKVAALEAPAAPTTPSMPSPSATSLRDNPAIKKSLEDYPDVVGPLLDALEPVISNAVAENTRLGRELSTLSEDRRASVIDRQEQALTAAHPDWRAACASKDFTDWLEVQPESIKKIVRENGEQVVNAEDAIAMVGNFKAHFALTHPKPAAPATPAPAAPTNLAARRAAQLGAVTTTPKGAPTGIPDGAPGGEAAAVFDHFAKRKAQKG